jgi:hypothetical protein
VFIREAKNSGKLEADGRVADSRLHQANLPERSEGVLLLNTYIVKFKEIIHKMEINNQKKLTFADKVRAYKNGDKQALDNIFNVLIDKEKHRILKIIINDKELAKNYSQIMKKYRMIDYDERQQLFHCGLMESIYKLKEVKGNKETLAYVTRGIIFKFRQYIESENHAHFKDKMNDEYDYRIDQADNRLSNKIELENNIQREQMKVNKYNVGLDDFVYDTYDKFSSADMPVSVFDRHAYSEYSHADTYSKTPTMIDKFLEYTPVENILTEAQMRVYRLWSINPDAKDTQIARALAMSQQNVSSLKQVIKERLNNSFDVFVKLNRHDTPRLTSDIIDFLDHIHKLKQYHDFADDDERLFAEVFDFIKKECAYITDSAAIKELFKNKRSNTTTIDGVLSENWTAAKKPSVNAQKALRKLEKAISQNDIECISKADRGRLVKHIVAAFERYLNKYKNSIIKNAKTNRCVRQQTKSA